jgi:hypothetical protein
MKRPIQSTIVEAQRWADKRTAALGERLTKKGHAKLVAPETAAFGASVMYERPELVTKFIDDLETQRLELDELNQGLLCELAALALERGELPPKPVCEYVAELLRQFIKWKSQNQRGSLTFRDGEIAHMMLLLEKRGIPLFPNRAGRRPGQTYSCDIVVEAFKKAGIRISSATVERVWSLWSRVLLRT